MRMRNSRRPLVIGLVLILCCCLVSSVWQMIREEIFSPPALSTGAQVHADGIELPIIMYHHFSENKSRLGDYVLSVDKFESDLKYIRDNGFTTVTVADLIAYVYDEMCIRDRIYVAPKYYEDTLLSLNQSQVQTYFIAFVIAIPAVFMLIAFVVYHRRRHL